MILTYSIHEIIPYINWVYFFHAWGFQPRFTTIADIHGCDSCRVSWLTGFGPEDRPKASESMQLWKEANRILNQLDEDFKVKSIFRLCEANAQGDNLLLDGTLIPLLRQQSPKKTNEPLLCLSDFVRPIASGIPDTVGVFASSVDAHMELLYENDPYKKLLIQTLSDRLAEAATEKMHEFVRKYAWGYAADEDLNMKDLFQEKFQGIRPAVGYPSLPDQSINFILDELLNMKCIGINLTENGAMFPHASVSGLMFSHPAARYFSIGKIGQDQLKDYSVRRNIPVENMRKFLAVNLSEL